MDSPIHMARINWISPLSRLGIQKRHKSRNSSSVFDIVILIIIIIATITMILVDTILTSNRSKKLISESSTPLKEEEKKKGAKLTNHIQNASIAFLGGTSSCLQKKCAPQASASQLLNSKQKRT
jgi:Na+-transporting NADH:ubiquinone oxidoreductase subunit NqrF